jgi:AMIN domain
MSRLSYAGALLAVAALACAPLSAQNNGSNRVSNNAPTNARVQHVIVRDTGNATQVEIQTTGAPVAPDTQAITGPDRIVVDFPGALPAAELRALKVNRGALKGVRAGLFFSNPPITRVVLDLTEPQSYQISTIQNAIVVTLNPAGANPAKLSPVKPGTAKLAPAKLDPATAAKPPKVATAHTARLQTTALIGTTNAAGTSVAPPKVVAAVSQGTAPSVPTAGATLPPMSFVTVTFVNGMLRIRAENATLAQVLFEVQSQTHAEIPIPAGAEREQVLADLGPAPAREVLAALLNGTPYNFIFVGNELSLERVILTLRDPSSR